MTKSGYASSLNVKELSY